MSLPSCTIALTFFEAPEPTFSYHCTSSLPGWAVQSNGDIFPPSRSRRIEFHLTGLPEGASFAGFQAFGPTEAIPTSSPWSSAAELERLGIVHENEIWPPPEGVTILRFDFGSVVAQLVRFRLAVKGSDGVIYWDDPKIYNDPIL